MNTIQLTDEQCREGGAVSMVTVKVDELEGNEVMGTTKAKLEADND